MSIHFSDKCSKFRGKLTIYLKMLFDCKNHAIINKERLNPQGPGGGGLLGPNFKIAISRKISPLIYPENYWLFLKHNKEDICKSFGTKNFKPNCLEAAWKSRISKKGAKTSQFFQNNMTFLTDKALKSKNFREQKVYILAMDVGARRKF